MAGLLYNLGGASSAGGGSSQPSGGGGLTNFFDNGQGGGLFNSPIIGMMPRIGAAVRGYQENQLMMEQRQFELQQKQHEQDLRERRAVKLDDMGKHEEADLVRMGYGSDVYSQEQQNIRAGKEADAKKAAEALKAQQDKEAAAKLYNQSPEGYARANMEPQIQANAPVPGSLVPSALWPKDTPAASADMPIPTDPRFKGIMNRDTVGSKPYATAEGYTPLNVGIAKTLGQPNATPAEMGQLASGYLSGGQGMPTTQHDIELQKEAAKPPQLTQQQQLTQQIQQDINANVPVSNKTAEYYGIDHPTQNEARRIAEAALSGKGGEEAGKIAQERATAARSAGATVDPEEVKKYVNGISSARLDPVSGLRNVPRSLKAAVQAEVLNQGYNLAQMGLEYDAAKNQMHSMTNSQQTFVREAMSTATSLFDKTDMLAQRINNKGLKLENSMSLWTKEQLSDPDVGQYLEALGEAKAELAQVLAKGRSPTNDDITRVNAMIDDSLSAGGILAATKMARFAIAAREKAMGEIVPPGAGPGGANRFYIPTVQVPNLPETDTPGQGNVPPADVQPFPAIGDTRKGHTYIGGDPNQPGSWEVITHGR